MLPSNPPNPATPFREDHSGPLEGLHTHWEAPQPLQGLSRRSTLVLKWEQSVPQSKVVKLSFQIVWTSWLPAWEELYI